MIGIPHIEGKILYTSIPKGAVVVIKGEPGVGKTTFVFQWMCNLSKKGKKSLFISTLGEPAVKVISDMSKFSFFSKELTKNFALVSLEDYLFSPKFGSVREKIENLIEDFSPDFVFIDSYKALESLLTSKEIRKLTYVLAVKNSLQGITTVLVGEWLNDNETPVLYIADVIFSLEKEMIGNYERKYFRVDKLRGGDFFSGNHPFKIDSNGITVYPRIKVEPYEAEVNPKDRCGLGIKKLDEALSGGLIKGTTCVVKGYAGLGKTTLCLNFLIEGAKRGERGVLISFQEPTGSIEANANFLGLPVRELKEKGLLDLTFITPTEADPDYLSFKILELVKKGNYQRVALDSIFDVSSRIPVKLRLIDLIYSLVHSFKKDKVTCVLTKELVPGDIEDYGISYMADTFILLKYLPYKGGLERVLGVIKSRGTPITNKFFTYEICSEGICLKEELKNLDLEVSEL